MQVSMAEKRAAFPVLALISLALLTAEMAVARAAVPAIFVFGDSILDAGNNNFLNGTNAKANYPHYGIDYPGAISTGRFSNGNNTADFLAVLMGFDQSPPPFLALTAAALANQMFQGINFASGGAGIQDHVGDSLVSISILGENYRSSSGTLHASAVQGGAISFSAQIDSFETVRCNMTMLNGSAATDNLLSNSFFLISIGSNDFIEYYVSPGVMNTTRNEEFVACVVSLFKDHLKTLYQLGARKFGLIGVPPIGCIPYVRMSSDSGDCSRELNEVAQMFHRATGAILDELQYELEGMKYSLGNSYDMVIDIYHRQQYYGYKEVTHACCGDGPFNAGKMCQPNVTYCLNRDEYLFWDAFHPTQNVSHLGAGRLYGGPTDFVAPINFMQLVEG